MASCSLEKQFTTEVSLWFRLPRVVTQASLVGSQSSLLASASRVVVL